MLSVSLPLSWPSSPLPLAFFSCYFYPSLCGIMTTFLKVVPEACMLKPLTSWVTQYLCVYWCYLRCSDILTGSMQSYHILHENENPKHLFFCRGTGHKPLNPASFVIADMCMFEGLTNHLPFRLILVCDGEPILSFWVMVRQKRIF